MDAMVRYTANDGQEVKLTPRSVLNYIVAGNAQPKEREIFAFMAKCQARGLNPLAGDCYMVTYQDRINGGTNTSVIVAKDYFVRTATQQESFDGMEAGLILVVNNEVVYRQGSFYMPHELLAGGWAKVYVKGWRVPIEAQVTMAEYSTGKKMWKSKPATMIRKVALVQALREAFPSALGGIYEREEMGEVGETEQPTVTVVPMDEPPQPILEPVVVVEESRGVEPEQRRQINELLTSLAKARGVSYATAKTALYSTAAVRDVGVTSENDIRTHEQAARVIGQLERWIETVAKASDEVIEGEYEHE